MSILKGLLDLLKILTVVFTFIRESQLRKEGEDRLAAELKVLGEKAKDRALEINHEVDTLRIAADDLEWLQQYKR